MVTYYRIVSSNGLMSEKDLFRGLKNIVEHKRSSSSKTIEKDGNFGKV